MLRMPQVGCACIVFNIIVGTSTPPPLAQIESREGARGMYLVAIFIGTRYSQLSRMPTNTTMVVELNDVLKVRRCRLSSTIPRILTINTCTAPISKYMNKRLNLIVYYILQQRVP